MFLSLVAVLALAGCGDDDDAGAGLASFAPPDSPIYIEARIQPSDEQRAALEELAGRFTELPIIGEVADPFALLEEELDESARDAGVDITFAEDIEPWLGERAAMAAAPAALSEETDDEGFVFALEVSDTDQARDSLERIAEEDGGAEVAEFAGVEGIKTDDDAAFFAIVDDTLVFAPTEADFQMAVDANDDDSLADSEKLEEAFDEIDDEDAIARAYVDFGAVMETVASEEGDIVGLESAKGIFPELDAPLAAALFVRDDGLTLDVSAPGTATGNSEMLRSAAADAVAAIGIADLGARIRDGIARVEEVGSSMGEIPEGGIASSFQALTGVSLDDATAALGDGVLQLLGQVPQDFAAQLRVNSDGDGATVETMLDALENFLSRQDDTRVGPPLEATAGFSAQPVGDAGEGSPIKFIGAQTDGETITATVASDLNAARQAAQAGEETLGDDPDFQAATEALGDDFEPTLFLRPRALLRGIIGEFSALDVVTGGSIEEAVPRFLAQKLTWAAAGMDEEDERLITRIVLGVD